VIVALVVLLEITLEPSFPTSWAPFRHSVSFFLIAAT
jgi:hypothetical protein